MTMTTSGPRISASEPSGSTVRAALNSGWTLSDVYWERRLERGNQLVQDGHAIRAAWHFLIGDIMALLRFDDVDPRRAASTANMGFALRVLGLERAARRFYSMAADGWTKVPDSVQNLEIRPRARSSLYHLRTEARHWDTYKQNRIKRLQAFVEESGQCLDCLADDEPPPHRLFSRWNGEKPPMFDDSRKLPGACLLIASRT